MSLQAEINQHSTDAIFFILQQEENNIGTPSGKAKVVAEIAQLLALINDEITRSAYVGEIYKKLGVTKTELNKAINNVYGAQAEENEDNDTAKLPEKFRKDFEEFGLYEEGNCYYFPGGTGKFERGSNFVIKPLFHIYSKTDNKRLIQIQSNTGRKAIIDLQSKGMVSLGNFQQAIFDEGNFLFEGTEKQFKRVLRKIGEEFPVANEVKTLGWQREGFYAFANGIHNSRYIAIDELGIVKHDDVKYFLPAFSSVYKKVRQDDDEYENERHFKFENGANENGGPISFKRWGEQMISVFGDNGKVAAAYLATSLARDIIYDAFKYFPHLFLFGEKGSGKSYLAWRLNNLFFHGATGFNLTSGTNVGFYRKLAKTRNSISWFDEYSDGIHPARFQALKAAFDGIGHEKGVMSQDNRTVSTKVNSALVISGQYLPTADDNALFTRSILLSFEKITNRTEADIKAAQLLEAWEADGLSGVIADLLALRPLIEKKYMVHHGIVQTKLKNAIPEGVESRIFNNYLVVLAMADLLDSEGILPMKYDEFFNQCVEMIMSQSAKIQESESLATFWEMIEFLAQNRLIQEDADYKYESTMTIRVMKGRDQTEEFIFPKTKRLFHFQWARIHSLYMERHRSQYGTSGLTRASLKHYLHTNHAFIGITKSTEFDGRRTSSYVFDADKLSFDLEKAKTHPNEPVASIDDGQDDLPF